MKIYVVEESRGSWSGAHSESHKAFFSEYNAEEFIESLNKERDLIKDTDEYRRWRYTKKIVWDCDYSEFIDEHDREPTSVEEQELEEEMNSVFMKYHEFDEHNDFYLDEIEVPDFQHFLRENKLEFLKINE